MQLLRRHFLKMMSALACLLRPTPTTGVVEPRYVGEVLGNGQVWHTFQLPEDMVRAYEARHTPRGE